MSLLRILPALLLLAGCGITRYPGQPGVVTNQYNKIDLEYLEADGLFVYETVYDNRPGGAGVGAIVTKLYPGAQTYTSNVRTNADGTLYRAKAQYDGAETQVIAIPALNQVHVSPTSKVAFFLEYVTSLDEIDDKNIAETGLFKPMEAGMLLPGRDALASIRSRWNLLKRGTLTSRGGLAYEVTHLEMSKKIFTPSKPVVVETTFHQNAVRTSLTQEQKAEAGRFLEEHFPTGYKGTVNLYLKKGGEPIPMQLGVHTLKTAEAAGMKIVPNASLETVEEEVLARFSPKGVTP